MFCLIILFTLPFKKDINMETPEKTLIRLNAMLEADDFSIIELANLVSLFKELPNLKFKLFDFVYYNEKLEQESRERKTASIKSQSYEMAARMRDDERTCQKHIDFKNKRNIYKSMFILENNQLTYLHFGNMKNDIPVLSYFKKLG